LNLDKERRIRRERLQKEAWIAFPTSMSRGPTLAQRIASAPCLPSALTMSHPLQGHPLLREQSTRAAWNGRGLQDRLQFRTRAYRVVTPGGNETEKHPNDDRDYCKDETCLSLFSLFEESLTQ